MSNDYMELTTELPFSEVENLIQQRNPREIRLEKLLKKREESLEQFLIKFFTKWNNNRNTIYTDDSSIQTPMGKRRSLGDIYMICKYYYPQLQMDELLYILYVNLFDSMPNGYRTSYCFTINKRVWYFDEEKDTGYFDEEKEDEFGNNYDYYLYHLNA